MKNSIRWLAVLMIALALGACAPVARPEQPARHSWVELKADETLGQTLVANFDGLAGVDLFMQNPQGNGAVRLAISANENRTTPLALVEIPLANIADASYTSFQIPALEDSSRGDYYLSLELIGAGLVEVGIAAPTAYLDGSLYRNGGPVDGQLTFLLNYLPSRMAAGLLADFGGWALLLLAIGFIWVLPGYVLFTFLWKNYQKQTLLVRIALAVGAGLAFYPLLALWLQVINLRPGVLFAWLPPLFSAGWLAWRAVRDKTRLQLPRLSSAECWALVVLALVIFTRFWVIRTLDYPMFGDSYQHTMATRLILDQGGLINSWRPYAPLDSFTYHYGFQFSSALLAWITGFSAPQAVLWFGQIANVLAIFCLYPLVVAITGKPWSGSAAMLIAGLLTTYPMFYVNWGRYTQLAGQAVLPVVVLLVWLTLQSSKRDLRLLALTSLCLTGLVLTHYRIGVFAVLFFGVAFFASVSRRNWQDMIQRSVLLGAMSLALFLPWLVNMFGSRIMAAFNDQIRTPAGAISEFTREYNYVGPLQDYLPAFLWILIPFGIGMLLWKRSRLGMVIAVWWLVVLLAAKPEFLNLPGAGLLSIYAVMLGVYMFAAVFVGELTGQGIEAIHRHKPPLRWLLYGILGFVLVVLAVQGFRNRLGDIEIPEHAMVLRPDVRAAAWITQNIPEDAVFLINGFTAYGGEFLVGSDAGWWLPLSTGRANVIPPLSYGFEDGIKKQKINLVQTLIDTLDDGGQITNEARRLLSELGITHIYIGQQRGSVNFSGATISGDKLATMPEFRPVYRQDRVWVLEVQTGQ